MIAPTSSIADTADTDVTPDHGCGADEPAEATHTPRGPIERLVLGAISLYRMTAPARTPRCRYIPSCSAYAVEAVEVHGLGRGMWLAVRRLGRCHPFGSFGFDPVPERRDEPTENSNPPERT